MTLAMRRFFALIVIAACAAAPRPAAPPAPARVFDFHSSPWLNLHLTLYREAIRALVAALVI
jgi:hypothetical protein